MFKKKLNLNLLKINRVSFGSTQIEHKLEKTDLKKSFKQCKNGGLRRL